jgi:Fic family protein
MEDARSRPALGHREDGALGNMHSLPLSDKNGKPLWYWFPDPVLEGLHVIDKYTSGEIAVEDARGFPRAERYLMNSIMEEAIASSLLEGAATTRKVAKEMIKTGRPPRTSGERMALNNYRTLLRIKEHLGTSPQAVLTIDLLHDLQRTTTEGTLENREDVGSFRTTDDIAVVDRSSDTVLHVPPPFLELPSRMQRILDFANERKDTHFIHPVLRGIILHFMVGYEHPYVDGNGRVARALFYWYLLSRGYWAMEYLAISRVILLDAPSQYKMAYLHSEADDGDLTYFIMYNLKMIRRAIEDFREYIERKRKQFTQAAGRLRHFHELNHRQIALLDHALRIPESQYTLSGHAATHSVSRMTARSDLYGLSRLGFLEHRRYGRRVVFQAVIDLHERIEHASTSVAQS